MIQNLQNLAKAISRGKFIAIQSYLRKQQKSQINNSTLYPKHLEKEEQAKLKVSRKEEIIKIKAEINEAIVKVNEIKSCFFEKVKKKNG